MATSQDLWRSYHNAVASGDMNAAKTILQRIMAYTGNPPPSSGGCAKCRKRFY